MKLPQKILLFVAFLLCADVFASGCRHVGPDADAAGKIIASTKATSVNIQFK